ncbi:MAG: hypothetical protein NT062_03520 [Proteobacteria bacterium]|nr:hypothetical protein [Pseudomonadota bacterium]
MKTFEQRDAEAPFRRSHPWTTGADPTHRYHDLRAHPELVTSVLEDFRPWDRFPAIGAFYALVTALNHPDGTLETNDCAFTGPERNAEPSFRKRLMCTGRLGVLGRDLAANTDRAMRRLSNQLLQRLGPLEPELEWGAVGTTRLAVDYRPPTRPPFTGAQLLVSFWAWGDDEPEVFAHLGRVIAAIHTALV